MTTMRKVVLQIECTTVLSVEELKDIQALVFGRMRSDSYADKHRVTIKKHMPAGMNHDVRGTLDQIQVNVVKEKKARAKAKRAKKERKAKAEPAAA
jgi:hypothetical protein